MIVLAAVSLAIWLYLAMAHGRFWTTAARLPAPAEPDRWPSVVAIVPARDEAAVLPQTLPTLAGQDYPGEFRVLVVDDDSSDDTASVAASHGAEVVRATGPPPGWTGKVAALATGVENAGAAELLLFTDADIAYPPDAVAALVRASHGYDLVSQMARLHCHSGWERLLVPAFVYFFAQLYPFRRINAAGRTAAAAGGCMLVRRAALSAAGGMAELRDAVIDDVTLGRLLKRRGRIWLGLSSDIVSVRPYRRLAELWQMVARSAYTQLRRSPVLLLGTVVGLLLTYLVPVLATLVGVLTAWWPLAALGGCGWLIMAATFAPMLRFYGLSAWRGLALPAIAVLYTAMTIDSARRHAAGRGAAWKGRVAAR